MRLHVGYQAALAFVMATRAAQLADSRTEFEQMPFYDGVPLNYQAD